ncbi:hypothetical protein PYW08_003052 [Mythimna loreyi]|uniref:Uncharacterized protein n=1 Tax=Mythimna loreyi TaxID=667449 RepID=A0ACC2QQA4_9NEOP|nr:hypothetical protein PYW08_003052 [Mythimna loreyi]
MVGKNHRMGFFLGEAGSSVRLLLTKHPTLSLLCLSRFVPMVLLTTLRLFLERAVDDLGLVRTVTRRPDGELPIACRPQAAPTVARNRDRNPGCAWGAPLPYAVGLLC